MSGTTMTSVRRCYVIGIDLGTTYSGVSWATSEAPDYINIIDDWTTVADFDYDLSKVPTEIYYGPRGTTWGYEIPTDVSPIQWFRALLLDDYDLGDDVRGSNHVNRARSLIQSARKTPVEVVGDYLGLLWRHTIRSITKKTSREAVDRTPFKVVLTVPAVWNCAARTRLLDAATRAGISDNRACGRTILSFVTESEAVALAYLGDFGRLPLLRLQDSFVVCDIGGGMVNLTSYTVMNPDPLVLEECVQGKEMLSGTVLDQAIIEHLRLALGSMFYQISLASLKRFLDQEWDYGVKRSFDGGGRSFSLTLTPEDVQDHFPSSTMILRWDEVRDLFDKVTPSVRRLVIQQTEKIKERYQRLPKMVLLVGGLGASRYIYKKIQTDNEHRGIEVLQSRGSKPWTAACRGAVIWGLNGRHDSMFSQPIATQTQRFLTWRVRRCNGASNEVGLRQRLETLLRQHNSRIGVQQIAMAPINERIYATVTFSSDQIPQVVKEQFVMDDEFLGFTPLYDGGRATVDIIAVTGLAGHALGSFKSGRSNEVWLRDWLPKDIPRSRIFTYGYDRELINSTVRASIRDYAKGFLAALTVIRRDQARQRPLIFIAHSLGGLVVKEALAIALDESRRWEQTRRGQPPASFDILISTSALVCFGVPNRGLRHPQLCAAVKGQPNEGLVRDIQVDHESEPSPFLELLHQRFQACIEYRRPRFDVVAYYELCETPTLENTHGSWRRNGPLQILVTKTSAVDIGRANDLDQNFPIRTNHSDLVKFPYDFDADYQGVSSKLQALAMEAPDKVLRRYQPADSRPW